MENKEPFTAEEKMRKNVYSEIYQKQTRRPAYPVPVFHGRKRYAEAEEEE